VTVGAKALEEKKTRPKSVKAQGLKEAGERRAGVVVGFNDK